MSCVVLFHRAHRVVFFSRHKRKINFKYLMVSWVDVGANSPWGETGRSYRLHTSVKSDRCNVLKLTVYINNGLHLAQKYARIFVRGHYQFREANSSIFILSCYSNSTRSATSLCRICFDLSDFLHSSIPLLFLWVGLLLQLTAITVTTHVLPVAFNFRERITHVITGSIKHSWTR